MDLSFDRRLATPYKSASQKARILTEHWVAESAFCPNCGRDEIDRYGNNRPVADLYCGNCREEYELKSKNGEIGAKIVNGAHRAMIARLTGGNNPNMFLLQYDPARLDVVNFAVVPKHFFVPSIIEKRKPLKPTARRAGWVGCYILISQVPESGRIFIVKDRRALPKKQVIEEWQKTLFLREAEGLSAKGWLLDTIRCVEGLKTRDFTRADVYRVEDDLKRLHPGNRHIKDKIRQQLQILRDNGYIDFTSRGRYRIA